MKLNTYKITAYETVIKYSPVAVVIAICWQCRPPRSV